MAADTGLWLMPVQYEHTARPIGNAQYFSLLYVNYDKHLRHILTHLITPTTNLQKISTHPFDFQNIWLTLPSLKGGIVGTYDHN
jgi:hypothetical protein